MIKKLTLTPFIVLLCVCMTFAAGRKPAKKIQGGIKTDGLVIHLASEKLVYSKFDALSFAVSISNEKKEEIHSEKIFSDYVEPASAIVLIAIDEEGTRYSGFAGNRTDPGEDFDHHGINIQPKKTMVFSFYHRELHKSVFENDRPFAEISDRVGTYTIHAQIAKDLFKTKLPLISNKIKLAITKK